MAVTESGIMTETSLEHPVKAQFCSVVTELGITTDSRLRQSWKALELMADREFGSTIEVRLWHSEKMYAPIVVTESGMRTEARLVQLLNALEPMLDIVFAMTIETNVRHPKYASAGISVAPAGMSTLPDPSGGRSQRASHPAKQAAAMTAQASASLLEDGGNDGKARGPPWGWRHGVQATITFAFVCPGSRGSPTIKVLSVAASRGVREGPGVAGQQAGR